jgi:hypothetical protein
MMNREIYGMVEGEILNGGWREIWNGRERERYGMVEGEILNGGLKEIRNFRGRDIDRRIERHMEWERYIEWKMERDMAW